MTESKAFGMATVLECLQEVGIKCETLGKATIITGGIDPVKAFNVPAFFDIITEGTGWIDPLIAQRNLPAAKIALFKIAIRTIEEKGGSLQRKEICQASTVETVYHFKVGRQEVKVIELIIPI